LVNYRTKLKLLGRSNYKLLVIFLVTASGSGSGTFSLGPLDLLQDEVRDGVGEGRGNGEEVRLGLVTILISDELELKEGSVGEIVTEK